MYLIGSLICFPILIGFILLFFKNYDIRKYIVYASTIVIVGSTLVFAAKSYFMTDSGYYFINTKLIDILMFIVELVLGAYIIYIGIKFKKYYVSLLSIAQLVLMIWLELNEKTESLIEYQINVDKLSIIMCVIIAVVGCLICIYALGYMKDYHQHHTEYTDRRSFFSAILFIFIGAMFGIVLSNHMVWMFFFWEITTFCSYLLIGYTKTKEAVTNSFRALWMNLIGGLGFAIAIIYCKTSLGTLELHKVIQIGLKNPAAVAIPILFLALAGLTKSAQFPFSGWLLGAMVAPTPSSALLHSATMVKAGVYLLIRLAPVLSGSLVGFTVTTIGGFTFMVASFLAVSQNDAKKLLAYSTIANLGLITACAGIGAPESLWAAILLVIFHAVSKSLMFISVGAVENAIGSRDIEDMHGLIVKLPEMALILIVGIAGMFLAPFGMLISKWAALKSFVDSGSMLLIFFLIFGSAATLFYWTKWLCKIIAVLHHSERLPNTVRGTEWFSLVSHTVIMICLCVSFPIISKYLIEPYLYDIFGTEVPIVIGQGNLNIMTIMLGTIAVLPFAIRVTTFSKKAKIVPSYMAGVNEGDDRTFVDSQGKRKQMYLANWYLNNYFGEKILLKPTIILSTVFMITLFIVVIGGAI